MVRLDSYNPGSECREKKLLPSPFPITLKIHQSPHTDRKVPMALCEFRV